MKTFNNKGFRKDQLFQIKNATRNNLFGKVLCEFLSVLMGVLLAVKLSQFLESEVW